jgi:hypothetical protein
MFEPIIPDNKLYPSDDKEDGREEWVAAEAIEIRCTPKRMYDALVWDGEQTGSWDVYDFLALWMMAQCHFCDARKELNSKHLKEVLQELAERYADQVLWPAYQAKVKNGDFD